jgi:hypothetical protein
MPSGQDDQCTPPAPPQPSTNDAGTAPSEEPSAPTTTAAPATAVGEPDVPQTPAPGPSASDSDSGCGIARGTDGRGVSGTSAIALGLVACVLARRRRRS